MMMKTKFKPMRVLPGNKVGWEVYLLKSDAEKRAKQARKEADKMMARGYDFGYQSPGSIEKVEDGYKVCVP
jgi:hypothetical protein